MIIEVVEISPPAYGKKVAHVKAADGSRYEAWPEKLDGVVAGRAYEIETREREFKGRTISSIETIVPAEVNASASTPSPSPITGEAEYVGRVLAALILKGEMPIAQIGKITSRLREIWRETG